jgi:hypothetical protein
VILLKEGVDNGRSKKRILLGVLLLLLLGILFAGYYLTFEPDLFEKGSSIEVDQFLFKVLLKDAETLTGKLSLQNVGNFEKEVNIESNVPVKLSETNILMQSQEEKMIEIEFQSNQDESIVVGKIDIIENKKVVEEIPLIIETESSEVSFDTNINLITDQVNSGEEIYFDVRFYNLENNLANSIYVEYNLIDLNGVSLYTESETISVDTQAGISKQITIPRNFESGVYVVGVKVQSEESLGTATTIVNVQSKILSATPLVLGICSNGKLSCWTLLLIIIVILFFILTTIYFFVATEIFGLFKNKIVVQQKKIRNYVSKKEKSPRKKRRSIFSIFKRKKKKKLAPLEAPAPRKPTKVKEKKKRSFFSIFRRKKKQALTLRKATKAKEKKKRSFFSIFRRKKKRKLAPLEAPAPRKATKAKEKKKRSFFSIFRRKKKRKLAPLEAPVPRKPTKAKEKKKRSFFSIFHWEKKEDLEVPVLKKQRNKLDLADVPLLPVEEENVIAEKEKTKKLFEGEGNQPKPLHLPRFSPIMEIKNPMNRIEKLGDQCYKSILARNLDLAEMYYAEMKPLYLKLNKEEKMSIRSRLVSLQHELSLLQVGKMKKGIKRD